MMALVRSPKPSPAGSTPATVATQYGGDWKVRKTGPASSAEIRESRLRMTRANRQQAERRKCEDVTTERGALASSNGRMPGFQPGDASSNLAARTNRG